jgi:hypothetical protein
MRNAHHENSQFTTAARIAFLLYLPFTDFDRLPDLSQIVHGPHEGRERYDPNRNNDPLWCTVFSHWLEKEPHLFPHEIDRLVQDEDFSLVVNPDDVSYEESVNPPPRHEQEWQRLARLPRNHRNIDRPREFLIERDVDLQHDWSTDFPEERLWANPETFVREKKQADPGYVGDEDMPADTLNHCKRLAFEYIVECFRRRTS